MQALLQRRPSPAIKCEAGALPEGQVLCSLQTSKTVRGLSPSPPGRGVGVRANARVNPGCLGYACRHRCTSNAGLATSRPAASEAPGPHPTRDARRPLPEGEVLVHLHPEDRARIEPLSPWERGWGEGGRSPMSLVPLDIFTVVAARQRRPSAWRPSAQGPALTRRALRVDPESRSPGQALSLRERYWSLPPSRRRAEADALPNKKVLILRDPRTPRISRIPRLC